MPQQGGLGGDQELLTCIICPRVSKFSDLSHLLTHVSSKGHLAQLHRVEVRSRSDIGSGLLLHSYRQWHDQHGIGHLLSERMVMKEAKQAAKREPNGRIKSEVIENDFKTNVVLDQSSPLGQVTRNRERSKAQRARHHQTINRDDNEVEGDATAGGGLRYASSWSFFRWSNFANTRLSVDPNDWQTRLPPSRILHCPVLLQLLASSLKATHIYLPFRSQRDSTSRV
jgi:hypothetical protein